MNNVMFAKDLLVHNIWFWKIIQYYDLVSSLGSPNVCQYYDWVSSLGSPNVCPV